MPNVPWGFAPCPLHNKNRTKNTRTIKPTPTVINPHHYPTRRLVNSPDFSDVRFRVEGHVVHAHRAILAQRCQHFRCVFLIPFSDVVVSFLLVVILDVARERCGVVGMAAVAAVVAAAAAVAAAILLHFQMRTSKGRVLGARGGCGWSAFALRCVHGLRPFFSSPDCARLPLLSLASFPPPSLFPHGCYPLPNSGPAHCF